MSDKDIHTAPTLPNQQAQQAPLVRRQPVTNIELLDAIERSNAETRRDIADLRRESRDTRNEVAEMRIEQRAQHQVQADHAMRITTLERAAPVASRYRGKLPSLNAENAGDPDGALSQDDRLGRAEAEIVKAKAVYWKQAAAIVALIVPVLAAGLGIIDRLVRRSSSRTSIACSPRTGPIGSWATSERS